jgi:hypothetical protein
VDGRGSANDGDDELPLSKEDAVYSLWVSARRGKGSSNLGGDGGSGRVKKDAGTGQWVEERFARLTGVMGTVGSTQTGQLPDD